MHVRVVCGVIVENARVALDPQHRGHHLGVFVIYPHVLQRVAACCSVLQRVAACSSALLRRRVVFSGALFLGTLVIALDLQHSTHLRSVSTTCSAFIHPTLQPSIVAMTCQPS